ncbi:unnamed protein product [Ostreobium quekettii]|uniref:Uncharacterized protein n=1 Tax=Ostreobium quekettii TaxID=121088 RepID=A0A8S1J8W0_9CHLO|nr:unnamed protein product [Ostreobium quekettii]
MAAVLGCLLLACLYVGLLSLWQPRDQPRMVWLRMGSCVAVCFVSWIPLYAMVKQKQASSTTIRPGHALQKSLKRAFCDMGMSKQRTCRLLFTIMPQFGVFSERVGALCAQTLPNRASRVPFPLGRL